MFEVKYSKFLTVLLVIIIIAIIGLVGYLGYSFYKNYSLKKDADESVSTFIEEAGDTKNNDSGEGGSIGNSINASEASSSNSEHKYKGFNYIGSIEIPKTDVKYFVLETPPSEKKLDTAVVALYPENKALNTPGNIVIQGHNYRNGTFFSDNKKLTNGDKIYITDLEGNRITYEIYNTFLTLKNDTSFYNRDTDGKREITLSSCTDASDDQRIIVEAREVE